MLLAVLFLTVGLAAQDKIHDQADASKTIDGIVGEVLNVISGEKGKKRDLDHFRSLFVPSATFTLLYHPIDSMPAPYESVTLGEFIELMQDDYYAQGFTETETGKVINEYNGIAQVFQSFHVKDSEGEEAHGITSYQLIRFNGRWWIFNVLWTTDTNGVPVPEEYLDSAR